MAECVICCEDMQIVNYIPPRNPEQTDVVVEDEELRLQCGHAFHTHCIVRALTSSMKCPLCNTVSQSTDMMSDEDRMRIEGRGRIILEDVRKHPEVRKSLAEWRVARKNFVAVEKEFRARTLAFKTELRKELNAEEIIKTYSRATTATNRTYSRLARKLGPAYYSAFRNMSHYATTSFIFKIKGWNAFCKWKIRRMFW